MSGKIKKSSEQMSFSLSRWLRKVTANTPTITVVTIIGLAYALFLFGGGLYLLIEQPIPAYAAENAYYFLYPSLSYQFGADTIISITLYTMGLVGLLAIYQSAKNATKPRQAYMLLVIGVTFVLLSYLFLETAIIAKGG